MPVEEAVFAELSAERRVWPLLRSAAAGAVVSGPSDVLPPILLRVLEPAAAAAAAETGRLLCRGAVAAVIDNDDLATGWICAGFCCCRWLSALCSVTGACRCRFDFLGAAFSLSLSSE